MLATFALCAGWATVDWLSEGYGLDGQQPSSALEIEVVGHRGARGHLPENSIAGAVKALELGAQTIELDVVVSKDSVLIVSHDHYFRPDRCDARAAGYALSVPLYSLTAAQIQQVTCGARGDYAYAYQQALPAPKPTLAEVIAVCEAHAPGVHLPSYLIEIKSSPDADERLTPSVATFASLLIDEVRRSGIGDRVTIQSFDERPIRYLADHGSNVRLAALSTVPIGLAALRARFGSGVGVYSPYHLGLTKRAVGQYRAAGIEVVPWTVNDATRMRTLISWGVDGMITDYPDRLLKVLGESR